MGFWVGELQSVLNWQLRSWGHTDTAKTNLCWKQTCKPVLMFVSKNEDANVVNKVNVSSLPAGMHLHVRAFSRHFYPNWLKEKWQRALHHCLPCFALHLLMYSLDAAARPWKPIPWSSLHTVLELIWRPHEVWRSVVIDSAESWRPLHPLTLRRHFTWPTTSWLSCCRSQSLPLCYNTTDSWLWNI